MSNFSVTNLLSFNQAASALDGPLESKSAATEAIRNLSAETLNALAIEILANPSSDSTITQHALQRYVLWKCQRIEIDNLFPFHILNQPGHLNLKKNDLHEYMIRLKLHVIGKFNHEHREPGSFVDNKPAYVINMPIVLGTDVKANHETIKRISSLFLRESFSDNDEKSKLKAHTRLALVLGANRLKSIDKERNTLFKDFIRNYQSLSYLDLHVFSFFWKPVWKCVDPQINDIVDLKVVSKYFMALKQINPELGDWIRSQREQNEIKINKCVPYQSIREAI